ncbi:MAG TPA: sugar ABC transporter permease [Clostridia bacterium]|nr:sugar ABC transporter permease [Clostridia bacterium]
MKKTLFKRIEPFLYLLPALVFIVLFTYYPFINTVGKSFFLTNSMGVVREYVGMENYIRILQDKDFLAAVKNTFIYVLTSVPASIIISLLLALIANKKTRSSSAYETMFAITMAMSTSVCAMIFQLIYNPSLGILNEFLGTKISWLTDSRYTLYSISFISVWMNIGYNFLFLLAAVRAVPDELLECANIEGANMFKKTTHIILPIISPTVFFLIVNSLARSMMMSGLVIILTDGGRSGTASTMISYMYSQAVLAQNYNNGFAAAIIAFIITFVLLLVSFSFEKNTVYYK